MDAQRVAPPSRQQGTPASGGSARQSEIWEILQPYETIEDMGITSSIVIDLVMRMLFQEGEVPIRRMVDILRISFKVVDTLMLKLQQEHLVEIAKAGNIGRASYVYRLVDEGMARARDAMERSQYVGPAPVSAEAYNRAIMLQANKRKKVSPEEVQRAISHLILAEGFHRRIGPAINGGTSIFLYGPPGNGKTTVAEAVAGLISGNEPIWLPFAITVGGQIVSTYDRLVHKSVELTKERLDELGEYDRRWALFQRPAVMVGGELTMEALDLRFDEVAKFYEAPLQLKANGGMFLIDDFGRQQMRPQELLNRWIVPLEAGYDYLRLRTGQTIQMPFQELIVFSTNLDPNDLVDGAFLRRIQMKVGVESPDIQMFHRIFENVCQKMGIAFNIDVFKYLLQEHYRKTNRTLQAVHPRDLLRIIKSICEYEGRPVQLTTQLMDDACKSYFV